MTRTRPATLAIAALLGAVIGFALDQVLTSAGRPTFVPAWTMPILLALLAVAVIVLAIPVRRAVTGTRRVDPFRAFRIAMLAKASSILGALLSGFGAGLLAFVLTRPVVPPIGSVASIIATVVSGVILLIAALIAEYLCTIRKDDDDESAEPAPGAAGG